VLRLPTVLRPHDLAGVAKPVDPNAARQAETLLRAWLATLDDALDPLAEVAPEPYPARTAAPSGTDPSLSARLAAALAAGQPLALLYAGAPGRMPTARIVEPRALERTPGGRPGLRAFCRLRGAERLFRLDRILAAEFFPPRDT
jgi:predicted DNA-binding transcriptional regulator YafY